MTTWKELSQIASSAACEDGEWAGAPMPTDDYALQVAPSYGYQGLNGFKCNEDPPKEPHPLDALFETAKVVNSWWSAKNGGWVSIVDWLGKRSVMIDREYASWSAKKLERLIASFSVAEVLDSEAELMAQDKLQSLIKPHLFSGYLLHGMILETSPKSGVTYLIRKGYPTLALRARETGTKILSALCLHPIGYYQGTHCGCMVPTDEVIAHLILIRTREHFFWRKANHHPAWSWQAGL